MNCLFTWGVVSIYIESKSFKFQIQYQIPDKFLFSLHLLSYRNKVWKKWFTNPRLLTMLFSLNCKKKLPLLTWMNMPCYSKTPKYDF